MSEVRRRATPGAPLGVPSPSDVLTPVVASAVAVVFVLLGLLASVANHDLLFFDAPVRDAVRGLPRVWFSAAMRGVSILGSRWLLVALTMPMAVAAWRRCRQLAVVLLAALPVGLVLELLLKAVIDRPRPPMGVGFGASFPSGHVIAAVAFWGLVPFWTYLVSRDRRAWEAAAIIALLVAAGVGVSRVYLGAHWPSDVVAGYLAGSMLLLGAEWAIRRPPAALHCEACDLHPIRGDR